jgi:hypothetical protein
MDEKIVPAMEELSDKFTDDVLPPNATLNVNINDKKFVLGASQIAPTSPTSAPAPTPGN